MRQMSATLRSSNLQLQLEVFKHDLCLGAKTVTTGLSFNLLELLPSLPARRHIFSFLKMLIRNFGCLKNMLACFRLAH